jgi:hypothetical protein
MRVFILISAVIFFSCKKPWIDHIRGTVYEYGSGIPVKGATIYLYKDPKKQNAKTVIIDSALSNEWGEYIINYSKEMRNEYTFSCKCPKYFGIPEVLSPTIDHGRMVKNITIAPYSYIKLRVVKKNNSSLFVYGSFNWGDAFAYPVYEPNDTAAFYQPFDYIVPTLLAVPGNQNTAIQWAVQDFRDEHNRTDFHDSFYIGKGDTLLYTISFD